MNSPNVGELGVTVDRLKACAVMSSAGAKPDALSDAGPSSCAVASSSHLFACANNASPEPACGGYPKVGNIRSRDVTESRDVERGVFEGAARSEIC